MRDVDGLRRSAEQAHRDGTLVLISADLADTLAELADNADRGVKGDCACQVCEDAAPILARLDGKDST